MKKVFISDLSDKRMIYAEAELKNMGYEIVKKYENCDCVLRPPQSKDKHKGIEYMKNEAFVLKNAYLTAEAALGIAINESEQSLINSKILIIGYGRIAKALHKYLQAFTSNITVCARNSVQLSNAEMNSARTIHITDLSKCKCYDFVFNTVPFPVLNEKELKQMNTDALIIDLASFPGGVDKHSAQAKGIKLIQAWGLPGKCSPKTAGKYVAQAVHDIIREESI